MLPGCRYKIAYLFAIADEANRYPWHFACFFPEQAHADAALTFLQCYSPHQREEADLLLNRLDKIADMIEYDQKIKGITL